MSSLVTSGNDGFNGNWKLGVKTIRNAENIQKGEVLKMVSTFKYKRLLPEDGGEISD